MSQQSDDAIPVLEAMRLFAYNVSAQVRATALSDHFHWNEFSRGKWTERLEQGGKIPFEYMDPDTQRAYVAMAVEWYPNSAKWEQQH